MKKLSLLLALIILSCNDGDVITEEFVFGDTYAACGNLVLFKTNPILGESLSFQITETINLEDFFATTPDSATNPALVDLVSTTGAPLAVSSTGNILTYRSYTVLPASLFCNDVPPSNLGITQEYVATTGIANFTVELNEDDNDGIPAALEDLNGNGDLTDDDTDGDGLPNYIDPDDDGDNVLTASEQPNYDIATGLTTARDTDGDGIADYLDTDDDGDNVLTIDEESVNANQNPLDDITNTTIGPDYLNDQITNSVAATAYREHTISQNFILTLNFTNTSFPNTFYDVLNFGTLNNSTTNKTRVYTPDF